MVTLTRLKPGRLRLELFFTQEEGECGITPVAALSGARALYEAALGDMLERLELGTLPAEELDELYRTNEGLMDLMGDAIFNPAIQADAEADAARCAGVGENGRTP